MNEIIDAKSEKVSLRGNLIPLQDTAYFEKQVQIVYKHEMQEEDSPRNK